MNSINFPLEMEPSWKLALGEELMLPYMKSLMLVLAKERYQGTEIYPPEPLIFNAFWKTPLDKVRVVILGQDPYHGENQAHGLSFSVPFGIPAPPSLVNIYKELKADLNLSPPSHGCLNKWAEQGVFLLNTVLTVRKDEPFSHKNLGWERFTDRVIEVLAASNRPMAFLLWGQAAQDKCRAALASPRENQLILKSPHPSPLSAHKGFFGSRPFSKINAFLEVQGLKPINWKE